MSNATSPIRVITPSGREFPQGAGVTFDAMGLARTILRTSGVASLATLDPGSGYPLATLVTLAPDLDGRPLFFLSSLALHTRNLSNNPRASLLLSSQGKGDPLAHPRLSLVGRCEHYADLDAKARFMAFHTKATLYADLPDFFVWRLMIEGVHLNGGFARAAMIAPEALLCPQASVDAFNGAQQALLDRCATRLSVDIAQALKCQVHDITLLSIDPDGVDCRVGGQLYRAMFAMRLDMPADLESMTGAHGLSVKPIS